MTFANGSIVNTWLGVSLLASADTGLSEPADFYFGSAVGETGASFIPGQIAAEGWLSG